MAIIEIYTGRYCPFCTRALALLQQKAVEFKEIKVDDELGMRAEMMQRSKATSVPQIFINDVHIGGCDQLMALEMNKQLDSLLISA